MKKNQSPQSQSSQDQPSPNLSPEDQIPQESVADSQPDPSQVIAELTNDLQRTRADFENFRKQTDLQKSQAMASAKYTTVIKFLPLIDDMSRAFSVYPEQLAPLAKSFTKTLESLNLQTINSMPGTEFNPDYHDAVSVEDGDGEIEVITETLRPGYTYEGAVIRPAMVRVGHTTKAES